MIRLARNCVSLFLAIPGVAAAHELLDTYHLAQEQDQTLLAAQYARDAAIEAHPQALAALLPQLNASGSIDRNRAHQISQVQQVTTGAGNVSFSSSGEAYYTTQGWNLSLSQTVFDWSAFQTLAAANRQAAQAQATFRSSEQTLIYRVADAYFNVLNAQDTLQADLDAQNAFQQQLEQAQKKFEVGLAAITDVRNAQASYDSSSAVVIADRRALDSTLRSLGQITGHTAAVQARLRDEIPLTSPTPSNADAWSDSALHDNPTLLSDQFAVEAAKRSIDAYRGKYLPTVNIVGQTGRQKTDDPYNNDQISDAIGLQANLAIFQGGLVNSQIRQAKATWKQADAQYEGEKRNVDQATRDAFEGVISGIASVNANHQAVLSNQTSLEASKVGLRVGTRTEVDVLTAQQALAAAQRSYYQSRYDYLRNVLQLKLQAGRLAENDLAEIDGLLEKASQADSGATVVGGAKP